MKKTIQELNEHLNLSEGKLPEDKRKELANAFGKFHSAYVDWMRAVNKIFGRSSKEAMDMSHGSMSVLRPGTDNLKKKGNGKYE